MIDIIREIITFVGLSITAIYDFKTKRIPVLVVGIWGVIGIVLTLAFYRNDLANYLWAIVPGIIMLIVSRLTRQKIGYGDGIILLILGIYLGWQEILSLYMLALMLAGITGIILLIVFHKGKNYEIPFVPYLVIGLGIMRCVT